MKKSILTFISVSLLLTSCSLFQKNNTEQISTLPTNQEQENKDLPPFDDSENNDGLTVSDPGINPGGHGSEGQEDTTQTGVIEEEILENSDIDNSGVIEEKEELLENKIDKETKQNNLSLKEQIINEMKKNEENKIITQSKVVEEDYTKEDFKDTTETKTGTGEIELLQEGTKYFITDLETAGTKTDNKYSIYFTPNTENKFEGRQTLGEYGFSYPGFSYSDLKINGTFSLEIETTNNYDSAKYFSTNGNEIKGKKEGNNKFVFEIISPFDLPSYFAEGQITFYKGNEETRKDKIRASKEGNNIFRLTTKIFDEYLEGYETLLYTDIYSNLYIKIGTGNDGYYGFNSGSSFSIENLGKYIIITYTSGGCTGASYYQVVIDKNGEKIEKISNFSIPKKINVGFIEYDLVTNNLQYSEKPAFYPSNDKYVRLVDIPINKAENISIDTIINPMKDTILFSNELHTFLPEFVYIKYEEFPIYLSYKKITDTKNSSFTIVKLTPDEEKLVQNDGKVMDIDLTDKLIGKYTTGVSGRIEGFKNSEIKIDEIEDGKMYEKLVLEESDLPIINLYKLDNEGYYSISFYEPYEYITYAELCKPAIYVYTSTPQNQSVEIKPTNALSYFTKTIPNFDAKNTWNYTTNPQKGNIIGTDKNAYDYLYYSIKVPNYEFNTDGWQVKGSDIKTFFEDKLKKIGFNEKEKNDFIEYWLELYDDKNAYYFVSFKYNDEIDKYVKLNFNKTPTSQFRVLLESYKLDEKFENDYYKYENIGDKFDEYLIKKAERNSDFDVFEWGGVFYRKEENRFIVY